LPKNEPQAYLERLLEAGAQAASMPYGVAVLKTALVGRIQRPAQRAR
jgi:hypothetical protein